MVQTKKGKSASGAGALSQSTHDLPDNQLIRAYKEMLFYRLFEERVLIAYTQGKFSGFCHLHIGQEALCVGVQHALQPGDYVFSELLGKVTGCSRGKGGSMHMFSKEHRFLGGHGIVGGQVPLATGVGFAIKYRKEPDIMVCYLGDAATNQGQFFESLNMAACWQLPVLFVIENNKYGMGTAISRTTSIKNLSDRALAFNMKHSQVDAMNYSTVFHHVDEIVKNMRSKNEPYLLEALTYRYKGHSVSDPATYRSKEEVKEYQARDPILTLGAVLVAKKLCTEQDLELFEEEARAKIKEAEDFADNSANPDDKEAWMHVYSD